MSSILCWMARVHTHSTRGAKGAEAPTPILEGAKPLHF